MPIGKICLDTETTGLDCFRDEIIAISSEDSFLLGWR